MSKKLSCFANSKDNNFNLLRMAAASAVLFSHSYALAGFSEGEPLKMLAPSLNMILGSVAVDVFFIISGFLVTGSLLTSKSLSAYFRARALRIYPALVISVLLTVVILGVFFTTLPSSSFFEHPRVYNFLGTNSAAIVSGIGTLPGVFEANPFAKTVNGSLWTIKYEVRLYLALGALWAIARLAKGPRSGIFKYLIMIIGASAIAGHIITYFLFPSLKFLRLSSLFFSGASFYVLRERIPMSGRFFIAALLIVLISAANRYAFLAAYSILLPYMVFFLAYIPSGPIRLFNNAGDYSYGMYIYAFPVQQAVAAAIPGVSVAMMLALSFVITLGFAVLSWHFVEHRALRLKARFSPSRDLSTEKSM